MRTRTLILPVLALALAACGSDTADDGAAMPSPTTATASSAPEPDAPAETSAPETATPTEPTGATTDTPAGAATVTIADFAFDPATIEVAVGDSITWTNDDSTAHTATVEGGGPDTGSLAGGASGTLTFDEPGTYTYRCAFHPGSMQGEVVVQ